MDYNTNNTLGYYVNKVTNTYRILRLTTAPTGTYDNMYSRPYTVTNNTDALDVVKHRVSQIEGAFVPPEVFSGTGGMLLMPSATPEGVLPIANGWNIPRRIFCLEVEVTANTGNATTTVLTGYTDYDGLSSNGLDVNMRFYINSIVELSNQALMRPDGTIYQNSRVIKSAQIINGTIVNSCDENRFFTMRPMDVFNGIHARYLSNEYESTYGSRYVDTRVSNAGEAVTSKRQNNLPNQYLSSLMEAQMSGTSYTQLGQDDRSALTRAASLCPEDSVYENAFLRRLSDIRGLQGTVDFTFKELFTIDPNVGNVTTNARYNQFESAKLVRAGQAAGWHATDLPTQIATILSQEVPAIMLEHFLIRATIISSNDNPGAKFDTLVLPAPNGSLLPVDIRPYLDRCVMRLNREVFMDISNNNGMPYTVQMTVDLYSDIRMSISINNSGVYEYVKPTFCDGVTTSVLTSSEQTYDATIQGVHGLVSAIGASKQDFPY